MMLAKYKAIDGNIKDFDLDGVIDCVEANSTKREGWTALVVYDPKIDIFIELRDSLPDVRGNSASECEEISVSEISASYGLSETLCMQIRKNPTAWHFINQKRNR